MWKIVIDIIYESSYFTLSIFQLLNKEHSTSVRTFLNKANLSAGASKHFQVLDIGKETVKVFWPNVCLDRKPVHLGTKLGHKLDEGLVQLLLLKVTGVLEIKIQIWIKKMFNYDCFKNQFCLTPTIPVTNSTYLPLHTMVKGYLYSYLLMPYMHYFYVTTTYDFSSII